MTTFRGVDHVGVGVADMDAAVRFYEQVGFGDVLFDYAGDVPGPDRLARVVMVANARATPIGPARIKLVQLLDGEGPPPAPRGGGWGELGICEICLHARGVQDVHRQLVAAGAQSLMEPLDGSTPPNDVTLDIAYVADPWDGKLELIEWTGLWRSLPGPARAEGVNHVAFGVADLERTRAFYEHFADKEQCFLATHQSILARHRKRRATTSTSRYLMRLVDRSPTHLFLRWSIHNKLNGWSTSCMVLLTRTVSVVLASRRAAVTVNNMFWQFRNTAINPL